MVTKQKVVKMPLKPRNSSFPMEHDDPHTWFEEYSIHIGIDGIQLLTASHRQWKLNWTETKPTDKH